jgi:hypothetical protein
MCNWQEICRRDVRPRVKVNYEALYTFGIQEYTVQSEIRNITSDISDRYLLMVETTWQNLGKNYFNILMIQSVANYDSGQCRPQWERAFVLVSYKENLSFLQWYFFWKYFVSNSTIRETVHVYDGYSPHVWTFKVWKMLILIGGLYCTGFIIPIGDVAGIWGIDSELHSVRGVYCWCRIVVCLQNF